MLEVSGWHCPLSFVQLMKSGKMLWELKYKFLARKSWKSDFFLGGGGGGKGGPKVMKK